MSHPRNRRKEKRSPSLRRRNFVTAVQIRAVAPAEEPYAPGEDVVVELAPEACQLVRP
jgi:hypothetical protein